MNAVEIKNWYAANKDALLDDLRKVIAFSSTADRPEEIRSALDHVIGKAAAWGMRTGYTAAHDVGWAEIGAGAQLMTVLTHVDVVGTGDREKWLSDPFTLTERDGGLFARGVTDDKGPCLQSLYALRMIQQAGVVPKRRIRLVVGTCEETVWTDMANYVREFGHPDYGYSPDGDFPIFNIEKGYCDARLTFREDLSDRLESLYAGDSPNTVPSRAVWKKRGEAERVYSGRSVHSSTPQLGDNSVLRLARDAGDFAFGRFITEIFDGVYFGERLGLDAVDTVDGIYVGRTSACPTQLRLENGRAVVNVNLRCRVGMSREALMTCFARLSETYGFDWQVPDFSEPMLVRPEQPFLARMAKVYEAYGDKNEFRVAAGASYAQTIRNCVCWGPAFAGDPDNAHQENECFPQKSFDKCFAIYGEYLLGEALAE